MEAYLGYLLVFFGGVLGSAHCVGMCGGFVLALGTTDQPWPRQLVRQVGYGLGRVFTYTVGGFLAGFLGAYLTRSISSVIQLQAWLCVVAGALLVVEGLWAARWLPAPGRGSRDNAGCLVPGMYASLLRSTRSSHHFLGGMINGFLPCGLVYAFLALAASRGHPLHGGLTMFAFGLGTIPILALVGLGAGCLTLVWRRHVLQIAAVCVIATGFWSIYRGWLFHQNPDAISGDMFFCHPHGPVCPKSSRPTERHEPNQR